MTPGSPIAADHFAELVWHDVECGSYAADLPLWDELASRHANPVLELGCGTGRVALRLALRGADVAAIDTDPGLVTELLARARGREVAIDARVADARSFDLRSRFGLVVAPMQIVQLLGGSTARDSMLRAVRRHLAPGGAFAAAIVEGVPPALLAVDGRPLPDVREYGGWVLSSLPVKVSAERGTLAIRRRRELVSPAGELTVREHVQRLDLIDAGTLEHQAAEAGLRAFARREIPATDDHVGSTVVILEAA